jgi:hypothetical protein
VGKYSAVLLFVLLSLPVLSQKVELRGYFTQDSARLGERVGFVLKASYPQASQLIFPDSTYDFSPFVFLEKKTFTSNTQEGITQDSAIYFLSNFSLSSTSYLSLPVFELNRYDSITYYTPEAMLQLKLTLDSIPEQLVFKENNVYQPLEKSTNWLLIGIITGGILGTLLILFLLFAKRIRAIFKKNREKLRWMQFERKWKKLGEQLQKKPSQQLADEVVGLWKGYLESITSLPFQEWTSSEIATALEDKEVFHALRSIDMIIYAGAKSETQTATTYLLEVAKAKYILRINQISHDKVAR